MILQLENYFAKIAVQHKEIESFFRMDINEAIGAISSNKAKFPCLVLDTVDYLLSDSFDNPYMKVICGFLILDFVPLDNYDKQSLVFDHTAKIGLDIIRRLNYDKNQCNDPNLMNLLRDFSAGSVKAETYGPVLDNCFGTSFILQLNSPLDLSYNSDIWNYD